MHTDPVNLDTPSGLNDAQKPGHGALGSCYVEVRIRMGITYNSQQAAFPHLFALHLEVDLSTL